VLISPDDLAQLEETLDVLSDPQALADIREGDLAYMGDVMRGADAVGTSPMSAVTNPCRVGRASHHVVDRLGLSQDLLADPRIKRTT
jgi:hypothetical protein